MYNLIYDVGILPFQEAVISASSHDRAKEMLREYLDDRFFHQQGKCKEIGFTVRTVSTTGVMANEEKVLSPFISKNFEEIILKISEQQ